MIEKNIFQSWHTKQLHPVIQQKITDRYKELNSDVIPVALNSGLCWPKQSFRKYAGTITIRFLEPIEPGLERHEFMTRLEQTMEKASDELLAESNF